MQATDELEAWIPLKAGIFAVQQLKRPDLMRSMLAPDGTPDPPRSHAGDEWEVPLWLFTLVRALTTAVYVPPGLDLAEAVRLVEPDKERRDGMAVMSRLGVFRSSDVIAQLLEWRE
jgi:hypothetical protein